MTKAINDNPREKDNQASTGVDPEILTSTKKTTWTPLYPYHQHQKHLPFKTL